MRIILFFLVIGWGFYYNVVLFLVGFYDISYEFKIFYEVK